MAHSTSHDSLISFSETHVPDDTTVSSKSTKTLISSSSSVQNWLEGVDRKFTESDPFLVVKRLDDGSIKEERSNRMRAMPSDAIEYWAQRKHYDLNLALDQITECVNTAKIYLKPESGRNAKSHRKALQRDFDKANRLNYELSCLSTSLYSSLVEKFESAEKAVHDYHESAENFITPSMSSTSWNSASSIKDKKEEKAMQSIENSVKSQFEKIRLSLPFDKTKD